MLINISAGCSLRLNIRLAMRADIAVARLPHLNHLPLGAVSFLPFTYKWKSELSFGKILRKFLEIIRKFFFKRSGKLFKAIGKRLATDADFFADCIFAQSLLAKNSDLDRLRHQFFYSQ